MPSAEGRAGRALGLLRSQGLGVACGLATVGLLGVGSFVMAATRDGASAGIALDDLRAFFAPPSLVHAWFYLLVPVLALYALNTLLATWQSVERKARAGVRSPAAYAPAVIHVGFLVAMLAHGVGGLAGGDRGAVVLARGADWQPLPGDGAAEARLTALDVTHLPGGMPKEARAAVEVRRGRGAPDAAVVGYNQPLSRALGSELHLLQDMGQVAVAELSLAGERCRVAEGGRCRLGGVEVQVVQAAPGGAVGPFAAARVLVDGAVRLLAEGRDAPVAGGRPLRLEGVEAAPAVLLRARSTPGNPLALAGALLLAGGLVMMARRFFPSRAREGSEAEEADAAAA
jgi:hypothetical protein